MFDGILGVRGHHICHRLKRTTQNDRDTYQVNRSRLYTQTQLHSQKSEHVFLRLSPSKQNNADERDSSRINRPWLYTQIQPHSQQPEQVFLAPCLPFSGQLSFRFIPCLTFAPQHTSSLHSLLDSFSVTAAEGYKPLPSLLAAC